MLKMGFIDSYKKLEKLCSEIYDTSHGVTAYIDEMENIYDGLSFVITWNDDLKMLKHCRWVRNKIAHEPGCTEKNTCEEGDKEWIEEFYSRMLKGQDPLATYRKKKMALKQAEKQKQTQKQTEKQPQKKIQKSTQKPTQEQARKRTLKSAQEKVQKPTPKSTQKQTSTRKTTSVSKNYRPASSAEDDKALKDGCLACFIIAIVTIILILIGYFW